MPAVQIEESELLNQRSVVSAVNAMLANPESRNLLLRARKKSDPNVVIPELDAAAPMNDAIATLTKRLDDEQAARERERQEAAEQRRIAEFTNTWEKQKSSLRAAGWRDEGIDQIEKHAHERGIPDLEVAAAHWEKLHPPAEPVQPNGSGSWGFFDEQPADNSFVKKMIETRGEDEGALNAEINAALNELRGPSGGRR